MTPEGLQLTAIRARFVYVPVDDAAESEKAGRIVSRDVPHLEFWKAGERDRVLIPADEPFQYFSAGLRRPVMLTPKEVFPDQWRLFEEDHASDQIIGTRLADWGRLKPTEVVALRDAGIRTVEELAEMPAAARKKVGFGADRLMGLAQKFLEQTQDAAALEKRDMRIAELEKKLEALMAVSQRVEEQAAPKGDSEALQRAATEFDGWADEAVRAYLIDHGVAVDGRWGCRTLREKAAEIAAAVVA